MRTARLSLLPAAILVIALSCGQAERGSPTVRAPREPRASTAQAPAVGEAAGASAAKGEKVEGIPPPEVGEAIILPAIEAGPDELVVAYKHSHHAYQDTYGFDTEVFRFSRRADGRLDAVVSSKRLMEGESRRGGYEFLRTGEAITLRSLFVAEGKADIVAQRSGQGYAVRGADFSAAYTSSGPGELRIERLDGRRTRTEEWSRSGAKLSDSAGPGDRGTFEGAWPRPKAYRQRPDNDPSGASEEEYRFYDLEGRVKFAHDSVEPVAEVLVLGLDGAFPTGLDLEALVLIELALGEECRITPFLARSFLARD